MLPRPVGTVLSAAAKGTWIVKFDGATSTENLTTGQLTVKDVSQRKYVRANEKLRDQGLAKESGGLVGVVVETVDEETYDGEKVTDQFSFSDVDLASHHTNDDGDKALTGEKFDDENDVINPESEDTERLNVANLRKEELLDQGFTIDKSDPKVKSTVYKWKLVKDSVPDKVLQDYSSCGVRGIDFAILDERPTPFADLFMHLCPGIWTERLANMNMALKKAEPKWEAVSQKEWFVFHGIIFAAHTLRKGGEYLFNEKPIGVFDGPNIGRYGIKYHRFKQIKKFYPHSFVHPSVTAADDAWYMISWFVEEFNKNRRQTVAASRVLTIDETMTAWKPRSTKTGGLPHLSYVMRKLEPLGLEWKVTRCTVTGIIMHLEIMRGKEGMKSSKYQSEYGATTACILRHIEATAGSGREVKETLGVKMYGDSWFSSVKGAVQVGERGHEYVGPVKTNHEYFPKTEIENLMKDFPGGTHLVFECLSPSKVSLVAIGYKYNSRNVLSFIATKNAGSTRPAADTPYLASFPDEFNNVKKRAVERPQVISIYFQCSNAFDKSNQTRQDMLGIERLWLTNDCWFRTSSSFLGFIATDAWHALRGGVGARHVWRNITMWDFVSRLSVDFMTLSELYSSDPVPPINMPALLTDSERIEIPKQVVRSISPMSNVSTVNAELHGALVGRPHNDPTLPTVPVHYREKHLLYTLHTKGEPRKLCRMRSCSGKRVSTYCRTCNKFYCHEVSGRCCFYAHLCDSWACSGVASPEFLAQYDVWTSTRSAGGA